jgi:hypothetical protein
MAGLSSKGKGALIRTVEGTLIEINMPSDAPAIFDARLARKVSTPFYAVDEVISRIADSIVNSLRGVQINASQIEIEFGIAFESEGNVYVTKSRDESNINIKITVPSDRLRPVNP